MIPRGPCAMRAGSPTCSARDLHERGGDHRLGRVEVVTWYGSSDVVVSRLRSVWTMRMRAQTMTKATMTRKMDRQRPLNHRVQ